MYPSATVAANATKLRNSSRTMPNVAVPVWFDHWGTYGDYGGTYANWGHVVVWVPGRGFLSSPVTGFGSLWLSSIEAVERTFQAKYRFWTLDINTLQVAKELQPDPTGRKPVYFSNWIDQKNPQKVPSDKKDHLLAARGSNRTILSGKAQIVGAVTVGLRGKPGTLVTIRVCRDSGSSKATKTHFIEEVTAVIPEGGNLVTQVSIANDVPQGHRLHTRVVNWGPEELTVYRYAQKFMVWR